MEYSDVLAPRSKFGVEGLMEMDEMQNLVGIPTTIVDGGGEGSKKLSERLRQKGSPSVEHLVWYISGFCLMQMFGQLPIA